MSDETAIEDTGAEVALGDGDRLSLGVAARLSRYLQVLIQARKMGKETISSQELADYTHVNSTQIRRDLSGFGKFGKRGVGYNVDSLVSQIRKILRRQMVVSGVKGKKPAVIDVKVGDYVRITGGPFADFTGEVTEVNLERERIKASVIIFGRATPVELEFNQVIKV